MPVRRDNKVFDPNVKYSISELRTLRTRYKHTQEVLAGIFQDATLIRNRHSGKLSRATVKKPEERMRIAGIDEVLSMMEGRKAQVDGIVAKLDEQYAAAEKYGSKPSVAPGAKILRPNPKPDEERS